jgi:polysaccharide pyruvyl transferase WcaK-like protein
VDDYLRAITSSSVVITERLHPAIIAACYGIPFLYLQTTGKSRDLQHLLQKHVKTRDIASLFIEVADKDLIPDRFRQVVRHKELPDILIEASRSIRRRLEGAAAEVARLLEAG